MGQSNEEQAKAIFHPVVDALAIGGLSIGFVTFLLVAEPTWNNQEVAEQFVILGTLINWPHFMATYFLLYGSKETVERYPWSTKWMPLGLGAYCLVAAVVSPYTQLPLDLALFAAGAYLAWHYTGQTWGMMATFSFLGGAPFEDDEKSLIRLSLRLLLVWHVVWFVFHTRVFGLQDLMRPDYVHYYTGLSFLLIGAGSLIGGYGMYKYINRIERMPPFRVVVPFVSIWTWYALLAVYPFAIFWVQISHALQYLLFPARVQMNRQAQKREAGEPRKGVDFKKLAVYAVVLVGTGVLISEGVPRLLEIGVPVLGPEIELDAAKGAIVAFINVHHYFADGAIWKLSNPAVRKELFAHVGD
ncbi:MAG: hypothetical protein ACQEVA_15070 [Myxococcota bacterium]